MQRVTSDFLQRATSATSNERILQRVTSDFTTSEEQRVNFNEYRATSEKLRLGISMGENFNRKLGTLEATSKKSSSKMLLQSNKVANVYGNI